MLQKSDRQNIINVLHLMFDNRLVYSNIKANVDIRTARREFATLNVCKTETTRHAGVAYSYRREDKKYSVWLWIK